MKIVLISWQGNHENFTDGKKLIVNIDPGKNFFSKKWKYID